MKSKIELESMFDNAQTMHLQEFINYYTPDTTNTGTVTGGEGFTKWEIDAEFATRVRTSPFTYIEQTIQMEKCPDIHEYDAFTKFGGAEQTANRIVNCVNNFDAMYNFIKGLELTEPLNDADKVIQQQAKEIINNMK